MTSLDETDLRRHVADAIQIVVPVDRSVMMAFLEGQGDCRLDSFEIDSLGLMEFCIALELSTGIGLTPEDVQNAGSLAAITRLAAGRKGA